MASFYPTRPRSPSEPLFLERIDEQAAALADAPAVIDAHGALSWRELHTRSLAVAQALVAAGGRRGERAAIAAGSMRDYVAVLVGILRAGMSVVPLSTMASDELLGSLLADSGARFLFADARTTVRVDRLPSAPAHRIALVEAAAGWTSLTDWLEAAPADVALPLPPAARNEFNIIYSSGTTGTPKGIVHDHALRAIQANAFAAFGLDRDARTMLTTPLYSNYSLVALFGTLCGGGRIILSERFDEGRFIEDCRRHGATHAFLVPELITRILAHPDVRRLAKDGPMTILSAGSPLRAARKRELIERTGALLVEIYGATEGGASTVLVANQFPDKLGSVGRPSQDCDIRIVGEDGREVALGETGEIVGRSATMMQAYLRAPGETAKLMWAAPDGQIFMRSGDIGYFDADGFLHLADRKKDVIISGGMNIYASDLEAMLDRHPSVKASAVVAGPSERWGETPVAFVVVDGDAPDAAELLAWVNLRLSRHQRIERVRYVPDLPRNDMGKVVKKELKQRLWET